MHPDLVMMLGLVTMVPADWAAATRLPAAKHLVRTLLGLGP